MIIHCITNYVAMDLTANALLAIGARPLMSAALPEMEELAQIADALLINIGTLDDTLVEAAVVAGKAMHRQGKPVVLDPVGIQVSSYRMQAVKHIIDQCRPDVIKGNAQEMAVLPKVNYPCVSVTTGEVDYITDGKREQRLTGGSVMQTQVTAMGCTAGALIAAHAVTEKDYFTAAVKAMTLMNKAGLEAVTEQGLGTYRQRFIDSLSRHA